MSYLEWTNELDVGVAAMNEEHKQLIALMNEFHRLAQQPDSKVQATQALRKLGAFTGQHFAHEEKVMASMEFPGLENHARLHKKLLANLGEHVETFAKTGRSEELLLFLKVWLKSHIMGLDTKYGQHANAAA